MIPGPVLVELDYWCMRKGIDDALDSVLRDVQREAFEIVELTSVDRERVLELRAEYRDLRVGFVDAAVLATVERLGELKSATLDRRHFGVLRPRHVGALELLPGRVQASAPADGLRDRVGPAL